MNNHIYCGLHLARIGDTWTQWSWEAVSGTSFHWNCTKAWNSLRLWTYWSTRLICQSKSSIPSLIGFTSVDFLGQRNSHKVTAMFHKWIIAAICSRGVEVLLDKNHYQRRMSKSRYTCSLRRSTGRYWLSVFHPMLARVQNHINKIYSMILRLICYRLLSTKLG